MWVVVEEMSKADSDYQSYDLEVSFALNENDALELAKTRNLETGKEYRLFEFTGVSVRGGVVSKDPHETYGHHPSDFM